jgi:hypothetical protein
MLFLVCLLRSLYSKDQNTLFEARKSYIRSCMEYMHAIMIFTYNVEMFVVNEVIILYIIY